MINLVGNLIPETKLKAIWKQFRGFNDYDEDMSDRTEDNEDIDNVM